MASRASFNALPTFLMDARALASPDLTVLLAGNKSDVVSDYFLQSESPDDTITAGGGSSRHTATPSSLSSSFGYENWGSGGAGGSIRSTNNPGSASGTKMTATSSPEGRQVGVEESSRWAAQSNIPAAVEISALTGDGVEQLFNRLARIILTKIELGEIDPDDPQSGIQYGDGGLYGHGTSDGSSIRSRVTLDENAVQLHRRSNKRRGGGANQPRSGMSEWEDVFRSNGSHQRRNRRCC